MAQLVRAPIYQQLYDELRALAGGSEYAPGAKFLTEREISIRFQVSRATSNKALSALVSEGVLEFRKGIGTFVKEKLLGYRLDRLMSFTEKAAAAGQSPSTQVLTLQALRFPQIDEAVREGLKISAPEEVWYMERLRLADGVPVIYERRYVVKRYCPKLTRGRAEGSLYRLWTDLYGLSIAGADESIRAVIIPDDIAQLMDVNVGNAGFLVRAIGYLDGERPLWSEETLYRGDAYEFHNRLGGIESPRPAMGQLVRSLERPANPSR